MSVLRGVKRCRTRLSSGLEVANDEEWLNPPELGIQPVVFDAQGKVKKEEV
jgi:hypothetical protein